MLRCRDAAPVDAGLVHFALGLDVDLASGELDRQTGILSALTDRERQLMIRNDDQQAALLLFAGDDAEHFCR